MTNIIQLLLTDPILNLLIFFYKVGFNNFGLAILFLTLFLKLILYPLSLPSLKMLKKQKEVAGELEELKKIYGKDKKLMAQKQMELYKKHGINPASGCLPQILQIIILFALYNVFLRVLKAVDDVSILNPNLYFEFLRSEAGHKLNTSFLYLNLAKPDPYYIMPILAGLSQFVMTKMMTPMGALAKVQKEVAEKTEEKSDDVMYNMQKQMMYLGPVMTVFIGYKFPSGLVFYWFLQTVLGILQQWIVQKSKS
ncbi:YidC/Oxa1 family membrane protein insertase [Candidatus Parcubacteria bacterium]|nr:YidC/Oxa1 family membrane protein insertase [Patescibacteria group bacterium]MBU4381245.1 YidC/Oxa1 family membrane protein insertase [Patescibacteria group bacterium]MCG2689277.1 YidC/Oxa1 family membrane protein insertase [Candidatus Parcubacteria bacterium]